MDQAGDGDIVRKGEAMKRVHIQVAMARNGRDDWRSRRRRYRTGPVTFQIINLINFNYGSVPLSGSNTIR